MYITRVSICNELNLLVEKAGAWQRDAQENLPLTSHKFVPSGPTMSFDPCKLSSCFFTLKRGVPEASRKSVVGEGVEYNRQYYRTTSTRWLLIAGETRSSLPFWPLRLSARPSTLHTTTPFWSLILLGMVQWAASVVAWYCQKLRSVRRPGGSPEVVAGEAEHLLLDDEARWLGYGELGQDADGDLLGLQLCHDRFGLRCLACQPSALIQVRRANALGQGSATGAT